MEIENTLSVKRVDRSVFSVSSAFDDCADDAYWLSCTPQERLEHVEQLRRINYGNSATARLQRVLELAQR